MADRFDIVECHMRKFGERVDGDGEFSRFGLSSGEVPVGILDFGSEMAANQYISGNLWPEMLDGLGEHAATLLLQLWIGSGDSMLDIVTLLFLSENASEENLRHLDNPYGNLRLEIDAWLRSREDIEVARLVSYAALSFYMNYGAGHGNNIEQLKHNITIGYDGASIAPAMSEQQIAMYNSFLPEDSVYRLRGGSGLAALLASPAGEPEGDGAAEAEETGMPEERNCGKRGLRLGLALAFMGAVLFLARGRKASKGEE